MTEEPKGITLEGLDENLVTISGEPINTVLDGKPVPLTRKTALVAALETYEDSGKKDKFAIYDLGLRVYAAKDSVKIDSKESQLAQSAVEKAWPQPGTYTQLCRWLEGGATS